MATVRKCVWRTIPEWVCYLNSGLNDCLDNLNDCLDGLNDCLNCLNDKKNKTGSFYATTRNALTTNKVVAPVSVYNVPLVVAGEDNDIIFKLEDDGKIRVEEGGRYMYVMSAMAANVYTSMELQINNKHVEKDGITTNSLFTSANSNNTATGIMVAQANDYFNIAIYNDVGSALFANNPSFGKALLRTPIVSLSLTKLV